MTGQVGPRLTVARPEGHPWQAEPRPEIAVGVAGLARDELGAHTLAASVSAEVCICDESGRGMRHARLECLRKLAGCCTDWVVMLCASARLVEGFRSRLERVLADLDEEGVVGLCDPSLDADRDVLSSAVGVAMPGAWVLDVCQEAAGRPGRFADAVTGWCASRGVPVWCADPPLLSTDDEEGVPWLW